MNITKGQVEKLVKELKIMFNGLNHEGEVKVDYFDIQGKAMVEVKTKDIILETHKSPHYLHGAFTYCNNYSICVEDGILVLNFGFKY